MALCSVATGVSSDIPSDMKSSKWFMKAIGAEGCIQQARESVFWPSMTAQVQDYVAKCGTCQMFAQKQQQETLTSTEFTLQPWNTVRVDLFHFAGMNFLMVVDSYSNFWEVDNLQDSRAETVILSLNVILRGVECRI